MLDFFPSEISLNRFAVGFAVAFEHDPRCGFELGGLMAEIGTGAALLFAGKEARAGVDVLVARHAVWSITNPCSDVDADRQLRQDVGMIVFRAFYTASLCIKETTA